MLHVCIIHTVRILCFQKAFSNLLQCKVNINFMKGLDETCRKINHIHNQKRNGSGKLAKVNDPSLALPALKT